MGGDKPRNIDIRLDQEEPDEGAAPGEAVEALVEEEEPIATSEGAAEHATEAPEREAASAEEDELEPSETEGDESIESIVEDLKRQRGRG